MIAKKIDFYFTVLSSYTYLALPRMKAMAEKADAAVNYMPIDIMKIFETTGATPPAKRSEAFKAYRSKDLARVAKHYGIPINLKPAFWPAPQGLASGMIIALQQNGKAPFPLVQGILKAVWSEDRNIGDEETLLAIAGECGIDGSTLLAEAKTENIIQQFVTNTSNAIERGVIGAPTFFIGEEMFWGQDRLSYVEEALTG